MKNFRNSSRVNTLYKSQTNEGEVSHDQSISHKTSIPSTKKIIKLFFLIIGAAIVASILGTLVHRNGADSNIPWGILLAFCIIGAGAWEIRSVAGVMGLGFYLIITSIIIWLCASLHGPGGDVMVPIASKAFTTFFSKYSGYLWLLGSIGIQVIIAIIPEKLFDKMNHWNNAGKSKNE